jgi:hypothetical protein
MHQKYISVYCYLFIYKEVDGVSNILTAAKQNLLTLFGNIEAWL